ncbi:MAG: outer membrane beta-barrel protein [Parvibaculum sp.]|uniref:outer membrane beta-barrel protein n=1 Tax=Parvibaculum sp. TaxID=2024848 RepID=UPI0032EE4DEC
MPSSIVSKAMIAAIAVTAFYAAPITSVSAQDLEIVDDRNISVRERVRPGYDRVGVRAGAFTIFPEASVTGTFDDNIYATDTNTESDFITTLAANVSAASNWSRHALNLRAGLAQRLYADNSDEDRLDWDIGGNGRLDITSDTNISAGAAYAQLHEDRGAPNAIGLAAEPTEYSLLEGNVALNHRFNRVTSSIGATYADYDYDTVPLTGGGTLNQDFRDREEFTQFLRLGYDVSPDTNLYIQGTLNQREYDVQPPAVAITRDSDGYEVVGGAEFKLTNLAQGGVYAGYQSQDYDDPTLSEIDGIAYGANVDWFVTPLTTVRFEAASSIQETIQAGASGYMDNSVGLRIDHEFMRNVILGSHVSFANQDFEGVARDDDVLRAGTGIDYLLNRNFSLRLGYDYSDRDSSVAGLDYSRHEIGLTLSAGL